MLLLAIRTLLQRLTGCCWSLPLFHPCFQYVDNKARLGGACNICPTSKPLQRASSPPLALCSELLWFIQFFSRVSAARLIGIPSNLFPNLNIPMKHRQIGGQNVRFALRKDSTEQSDVCSYDEKFVDFSSPDLNSNAIALRCFNSNLSREMCSNCWLCPRLKNLFGEVLYRSTTDVDFRTAFLRGKDG